MKPVLKILALSLAALSISLIAAEFSVRAIFKTSTEDRRQFAQSAWGWPINRAGSFNGPLMGAHIPHPLWGFNLNPKIPGINQLGFDDENEFPYKKKENEVVVGIFGGSVAEQARTPLVKYLEDFAGQKLKTGCPIKIKVLNFSQGGHKQPSQFHIFSYFIDTFDIAINIDGHNDAFFDPGLNLPSAYPLFTNELFMITPEKHTELNIAYRYAKVQYYIAKLYHDNPTFLKSDLVFILLKKLFASIDQRKIAIMNQIKFGQPPAYEYPTKDGRRDELVGVWEKYIGLQSLLSKELKKKSMFFLQPSQYAEGSKIFSEEELRTAFKKDPHALTRYQNGYKKLQNATQRIAKHNIEIYDFSRLFAKETDTLFIDDCCHLSGRGNMLLVKAVAEKLLPYINKTYCH